MNCVWLIIWKKVFVICQVFLKERYSQIRPCPKMIIVIKTEVERKDKQQFMLVLLKKNVTQLKFINLNIKTTSNKSSCLYLLWIALSVPFTHHFECNFWRLWFAMMQLRTGKYLCSILWKRESYVMSLKTKQLSRAKSRTFKSWSDQCLFETKKKSWLT